MLDTFSAANTLATAELADIPDMPLVNEALADCAPDHFAGFAMIAVQHMYASVAGVFDAMAAKGLRHEHMTVIGKPYSTAFGVARQLVERGVRVPIDTAGAVRFRKPR